MLLYYTKGYKPRVSSGDAGVDLRSIGEHVLEPNEIKLIPTGVSWDTEGFWGLITGRSSMNLKGLIVHQGVIDRTYRGEFKVVLQNLTDQPITIKDGERIAQCVILSSYTDEASLVEGVAEENTQRGTGGFGSTNNED